MITPGTANASVAKLFKSGLLAVAIVLMIYIRKQMASVTTYKAKYRCDSRELLMDRRHINALLMFI